MGQFASILKQLRIQKGYTQPELAARLGISRSAAYNLMHRADFPSFRIGKRLLVTQDKVFEWVDAQTSAHAQLTFD